MRDVLGLPVIDSRFLPLLLVVSAMMCVASTAHADQPVKDVQVIRFSTVIPAGTAWNSPVRFGEVCAFDVALTADDQIVTWEREDRTTLNLEFDDLYTNLTTGYSFSDTANYSIQFDHESGFADHSGIFWKVLVGNHIAVLDVGSFTQNWNLPFPQPAEDLKGVHDVNAAPFGTFSYCDWLEGNFPVPR
jgi:hypothetical protein